MHWISRVMSPAEAAPLRNFAMRLQVISKIQRSEIVRTPAGTCKASSRQSLTWYSSKLLGRFPKRPRRYRFVLPGGPPLRVFLESAA